MKIMKNLPLSWSSIESNKHSSVTISKWNLSWLAINILPNNTLIKFYKNFDNKSKLIIRGCNKEFAAELENKGFSKIHFGMEAVLHTKVNHFDKKSLNSLIKRGLNKGNVKKIIFNEENKIKFNELKNSSIHSNEPQLKNLFQTEFTPYHHLYVFISNNNEWMGAILASENKRHKLHTELLLRKKDSPNGMMESLIYYMFNDAKEHNFKQLSLGEVPFRFSENIIAQNPFKFIGEIGKFLTFAYNHKGLFNFKNKFQPEWIPLYICSSNKIGFRHFLLILFSSNFHSLLLYKSFYKLKNILLSFSKNHIVFVIKKLDFNKT